MKRKKRGKIRVSLLFFPFASFPLYRKKIELRSVFSPLWDAFFVQGIFFSSFSE
jgi:hypothetical protein